MNPFALIGIVVDLAGVGLIVAGALITGDPRWPLIASGATLSLIGTMMFIIGRSAGSFYGTSPRLAARGITATALVEKMQETGTFFRGSPVVSFGLKVTHQARDYPVEVRQALPRSLRDSVLPGSRVAVRVDPEEPNRVVVDWSEAPRPPRLTPEAVGRPGGTGRAEAITAEQPRSAADVLARGRRGTARILAAREMGDAARLGIIAPDDERAGAMMVLFDLEVKLPGRDPYPARVAHWVPASQVGKVGPGREVVVAVGREDPEREVAIDWEASLG